MPRGRWWRGVSLSHSRGRGEYAGVAGGQVASSVTGLYPWLGYQATERLTVWGVAGGFALGFKADALWVGTSTDGVDGPARGAWRRPTRR